MKSDKVINCRIGKTCECGGRIVLKEETIHQKVELPKIKPIVTEYKLQKGHCKVCNRRVSANAKAVID